MSQPLEILKQTLQGQKPGLALDIDDTLSLTWAYWVQELTRRCGPPDGGLSWQEIRRQCGGRIESVPQWSTEEAFAVMEEMRHSHDHIHPIACMPDSSDMVTLIQQEWPIHLYLTARPEPTVEATRAWLKKHSFPDVPIISRPISVDKTASYTWKAQILQELYPMIQGMVDDDVNLARALPATYQGTLFLIGHERAERTDIRIVHCPTWQDVRQAVQKMT